MVIRRLGNVVFILSGLIFNKKLVILEFKIKERLNIGVDYCRCFIRVLALFLNLGNVCVRFRCFRWMFLS